MIDFKIDYDNFDIKNSTEILLKGYEENLLEVKKSLSLLEQTLSKSMFPIDINKEIKQNTSNLNKILKSQEKLENNYIENIVINDFNNIQKLISDELGLGQFKITSTINTARFETKKSKTTIKLIEKSQFHIQTIFKYKDDLLYFNFHLDIEESDNYSIKMNHTIYPSFRADNSPHLRNILNKNRYDVASHIISNANVIQTCSYLYKLNKIRIKNKNETFKIIKENFAGTTIISNEVDKIKLQDCIDKASLFDLVLER